MLRVEPVVIRRWSGQRAVVRRESIACQISSNAPIPLAITKTIRMNR